MLWSIAVVWMGIPNALFLSGHAWFELEDPMVVASVGVLAGLVCGGYARCRVKCRQVGGKLRKGLVFCAALILVACVWFGWTIERANKQRQTVAWVQKSGGTVRYGHQEDALPKPGPDWFRDILGIDFFDHVVRVSVDYGDGDIEIEDASDVSPLARLRRLKVLRLRNTRATNLTSLAKLTDLTDLDLTGTSVSDVMPLAGLPSLKMLDLTGTRVTDVSPLGSCPSLWSLRLNGCGQLTEVSGLRNASSLRTLQLNGCRQLTHVSGLGDCYSLHFLELSMCSRLTDVPPLPKLRQLQTLNLRGTPVSEEAVEKLRKTLPAWCPIEY